jgi:hypothetical protein
MTALLIGEAERSAIADLVATATATANVVDVIDLAPRLNTPTGKAAHMAQMSLQTIDLPVAFRVTYSIETGHGCGVCRHMSVSVNRDGRVPGKEAVWMIAEMFGFRDGLSACAAYIEDLKGHGMAVNVIQPIGT